MIPPDSDRGYATRCFSAPGTDGPGDQPVRQKMTLLYCDEYVHTTRVHVCKTEYVHTTSFVVQIQQPKSWAPHQLVSRIVQGACNRALVPRGEVRAARRALAHRAGAMLAEQTGVRCLHFVAPSSNRGSAGRCHSAPGTGRGFATASPSKSPHRNTRSLRFKVTAV